MATLFDDDLLNEMMDIDLFGTEAIIRPDTNTQKIITGIFDCEYKEILDDNTIAVDTNRSMFTIRQSDMIHVNYDDEIIINGNRYIIRQSRPDNANCSILELEAKQ